MPLTGLVIFSLLYTMPTVLTMYGTVYFCSGSCGIFRNSGMMFLKRVNLP